MAALLRYFTITFAIATFGRYMQVTGALRSLQRFADSPAGRAMRARTKVLSSSMRARLLYTWRLPPTMRDRSLYRPLLQPWLSDEWSERLREGDQHSFVAPDAKFVLYRMLEQAIISIDGDVAECGVYRGGTARLFAEVLKNNRSTKELHLFDTFEGMPETDRDRDFHKAGDFADTSLSAVQSYVSEAQYESITYHPGFVPQTLEKLSDRSFCFAHIDLDIYKPILEASAFFYERMHRGAVLIYDDYAWPSCPGARQAVDEFFDHKPERPLVLASGQCLVIKV